MSDSSNNNESNVEGTINAVAGLAKAVPVYEDALQPAAKEIGKALGTVAKTVNVALAPVSALVWGYDKIKDFVDTKVSEKLSGVKDEDIVSPPPNVAGPALESLKYTGCIEELKELYANLIASSMDKNTTHKAHPSFVEIIKQLSPDEAKLLTYFKTSNAAPIINIKNNRKDKSGGRLEYRYFTNLGEQLELQNLSLIPSYWDNLIRLGIVDIPDNNQLLDQGVYDDIIAHPAVESITKGIDKQEDRVSEIKKTAALVTDLGRQFIDTCVVDHRAK
ncbi:DUF4393 domain-containing protein [Vibrio anguillarum]|uniref:DUF4393 domain-containing protein n=1 Tax=Vibrio TaxID=662 RepID=UPI0002E5E1E8|nr:MULTISPECIES: DUF4393 domain-containing protein [Vibrio]POC02566.1 DUF4393 domain-containing protein [Vibrio vulnificus]MDQ2194752.1 DUF4393 domain-containing protein [Vibrio sp. A14(2019)]MDQ2198475.1 DUF4393 domain-containing protein [Vibrio sp. 2017_1457_11]NNN77568.1 DUF4393 domain-containing protein [Vibrio sp. B7]NNN94358.1 DUF4393 domain-containing protein [Vibrio sp. B8-1]